MILGRSHSPARHKGLEDIDELNSLEKGRKLEERYRLEQPERIVHSQPPTHECDLRVNEYAAYSLRQLFANAAIAASRASA
jgi:hypothetical protein